MRCPQQMADIHGTHGQMQKHKYTRPSSHFLLPKPLPLDAYTQCPLPLGMELSCVGNGYAVVRCGGLYEAKITLVPALAVPPDSKPSSPHGVHILAQNLVKDATTAVFVSMCVFPHVQSQVYSCCQLWRCRRALVSFSYKKTMHQNSNSHRYAGCCACCAFVCL